MRHSAEKVLLFSLLLWSHVLAQSMSKKSTVPKKKSGGLGVPLSAIILLSVLGGCLIIFAIAYKFISLDKCCSGSTKDKDKDKSIDRGHYAEIGQSDAGSAEDKQSQASNVTSSTVTASNPVIDHTDFGAGRGRGRPKAKSVTSLYKNQLPQQQRRPSAIPTTPPQRRDRLSLVALENITGGRVRSESDLSLGASASYYHDQYSSWGDSLGKIAPPRKPISPLVTASQGRRSRGQRAMSAYGDIISLRPPNISHKLVGRLQVSVAYAPTAQRLEVEVIRVEQLHQSIFQLGLASEIVVHIALLPSKRARFKTKAKPIHNPSFQERWVVKSVSRPELEEMKMRFRIYSHEFIGKGKLFGEAVEDAVKFELEDIGATMWMNVTPSEELKKLISGPS